MKDLQRTWTQMKEQTLSDVSLWLICIDPFQNWIHLSIKSLAEKFDGSGGGIEAEREKREETDQGLFRGVPSCETGELWVTWRLGTQGPKGQGGVGAQEERGMAQDGMGATNKVPRGHWVPQLWLKRADVCFDSSFVSTCHVCVCSWVSHCGPFSRGQFEPEKAGSSWF